MALSGTLRDFGIAEIFQLIGQQQKTGILRLRDRDDEIEILFDSGAVVSADRSNRRDRHRLGSLLTRARLLQKDQLEQALKIQRKTGLKLGVLLVREGFVSQETLSEFIALQTRETIFQLFHWSRGSYEFETVPIEYDKALSPRFQAEHILLDGFRVIDEWPQIRRKVPSMGAIYKRRQAAEIVRSQMSATLMKVWDLVDGERMVEEIVALARLGEFETCKALAELIDMGLLAALPVKQSVMVKARNVAELLRDQALWAMLFVRLFTALVLIGLTLALFAGVYYTRLPHLSRAGPDGKVRRLTLDAVLGDFQLIRIDRALEVYRFETGRYPASLEKLLEQRLLTQNDLEYPFKAKFIYERHGEGYLLLPPRR